MAFKMSGICCGQSTFQVKCPLWTYHSDKKGTHLVGYYRVYPLQVNLDEMGLKIKDKVEAVVAPYKEVHKDMQKKAKKPKKALHKVLSLSLHHVFCHLITLIPFSHEQ